MNVEAYCGKIRRNMLHKEKGTICFTERVYVEMSDFSSCGFPCKARSYVSASVSTFSRGRLRMAKECFSPLPNKQKEVPRYASRSPFASYASLMLPLRLAPVCASSTGDRLVCACVAQLQLTNFVARNMNSISCVGLQLGRCGVLFSSQVTPPARFLALLPDSASVLVLRRAWFAWVSQQQSVLEHQSKPGEH